MAATSQQHTNYLRDPKSDSRPARPEVENTMSRLQQLPLVASKEQWAAYYAPVKDIGHVRDVTTSGPSSTDDYIDRFVGQLKREVKQSTSGLVTTSSGAHPPLFDRTQGLRWGDASPDKKSPPKASGRTGKRKASASPVPAAPKLRRLDESFPHQRVVPDDELPPPSRTPTASRAPPPATPTAAGRTPPPATLTAARRPPSSSSMRRAGRAVTVPPAPRKPVVFTTLRTLPPSAGPSSTPTPMTTSTAAGPSLGSVRLPSVPRRSANASLNGATNRHASVLSVSGQRFAPHSKPGPVPVQLAPSRSSTSTLRSERLAAGGSGVPHSLDSTHRRARGSSPATPRLVTSGHDGMVEDADVTDRHATRRNKDRIDTNGDFDEAEVAEVAEQDDEADEQAPQTTKATAVDENASTNLPSGASDMDVDSDHEGLAAHERVARQVGHVIDRNVTPPRGTTTTTTTTAPGRRYAPVSTRQVQDAIRLANATPGAGSSVGANKVHRQRADDHRVLREQLAGGGHRMDALRGDALDPGQGRPAQLNRARTGKSYGRTGLVLFQSDCNLC